MTDTLREGSPLVERVAKHPKVQQIARLLRGDTQRIDLAGLRGSSPAFVVEAMRLMLGRTVVVVCADEEKAEDAWSDLRTISGGDIQLFPEKDIFPQSFELKENLTVRGKRNACLDHVMRRSADVVVTSLPGFLERTMSVAALRDNAREFAVGERIELEHLKAYLVEVGYEHVHTVEELGQFGVRGSIVDIFDPSWMNPVRLEFLDDEIDSMRTFDIDSQRSLERIDKVRVLPAVSVLVNDDTLASLATHLRTTDMDADTIEEVTSEIEHHRFSYLLRRYAPAMGMSSSLLDFFSEPPVVLFWGEESIGAAYEKLEADYDKVARLIDDQYPILPLADYTLPPTYYTDHRVSAVHLWDIAGAGRAQEDVGSVAPSDTLLFHTSEHPTVLSKLDSLLKSIRKLSKKGAAVYIYSESAAQRERLADMLGEDEDLVHLPVGWLTSGFIWDSAAMALLTDHQIFHRNLPRPSDRRKTRRSQGYRHDHLQVGDYVVHVDYGIGRYVGLEKVAVEGGETECLTLRYDGNDRIFVPLHQMPLVEKYIGKEGAVPKLDRLGSGKWQRTKAKTKKALEDVAREMLDAFAKREVVQGHAFKLDTQWQKELEAAFPFEETPDQLRSSDEVKVDMETSRPMDRLICGDVGFGKTEVAIRAAFKAINDGRQVAILVPTTILALQHYKTFGDRMAVFPVKVEMLSRFRSAAEQKEIIKGLAAGSIDLVIGTHRLLSKDIRFHNLGLLIIDEEHRFGVRSKEKLKQIKTSVDVLSMTATPIPRTLYMAVSGLKPISVIDTPPRNRHPVKTEVLPFDEDTIVQAISAEVARDGQVFFVHNRVASIYSIQAFLQRLMPELRIAVGHGQMAEKELERVILGFLNKEYDVLLCTTIIESGLDFPNVNTIIINRADRFGLAELYQLRGRVGRRERQAFAYLLVPRNFSITHDASRRLQAMEEFDELGSGYRLAMRDLEIRGAGNVLGLEQSGQLVSVGFDLYCKMLKEAVERLQGVTAEERAPVKIETRVPAYLPDSFVDDQNERMTIYRRLGALENPADLEQIGEEIVDRFGDPPREALNLMDLTEMKLRAQDLGIATVQIRPDRVILDFLPEKVLRPEVCARLVETFEGRVLFKSGSGFALTLSVPTGGTTFAAAIKLLKAAWSYVKTNDPLASGTSPASGTGQDTESPTGSSESSNY